jgi:hypothetical protein
MFGAADTAVILRIRKSKEATFDGISFHRLLGSRSGRNGSQLPVGIRRET